MRRLASTYRNPQPSMTAVTMKALHVNTTTQPVKKFQFHFPHSRHPRRTFFWTSTLCGLLADHFGWGRGTFIRRAFVQISRRPLVASLRHECWLVAFGLSLILIGMSTAYAQTEWQGPAGASNWFSAANWSLGTPTIAQSAAVNNGNTAEIPVSMVHAQAAILTIGPMPGSTVHMNGGILDIGPGGTGTIKIEPGGTFQITSGFGINADDWQNNGIILNDHPSGDYRIFGNTVISGSGEFVFTGTGTFSLETNNTYTGKNNDQCRRNPARCRWDDWEHHWRCPQQRNLDVQPERFFHLWRSDQRHGKRPTEWDWNNGTPWGQHLLRNHHDQRRGAKYFAGRQPRHAPQRTGS